MHLDKQTRLAHRWPLRVSSVLLFVVIVFSSIEVFLFHVRGMRYTPRGKISLSFGLWILAPSGAWDSHLSTASLLS